MENTNGTFKIDFYLYILKLCRSINKVSRCSNLKLNLENIPNEY